MIAFSSSDRALALFPGCNPYREERVVRHVKNSDSRTIVC